MSKNEQNEKSLNKEANEYVPTKNRKYIYFIIILFIL